MIAPDMPGNGDSDPRGRYLPAAAELLPRARVAQVSREAVASTVRAFLDAP